MSARSVPLAPGETLIHVGMPKTGTTAIQNAAATRRKALSRQGVCYPGTGLNHQRACNALMERSTKLRPAPPRSAWDAIRNELRANAGRVGWLSYEQIVQADDRQARRFVDELGAGVAVVVGVRPYAEMVASAWQQWVREGEEAPIDRWVADVLRPSPESWSAGQFWVRHDLTAIVERWVSLIGPERVAVVVVDRRAPSAIFGAFEELVALRSGTLSRAARRGAGRENRSLSWVEVELVRDVLARVRATGVSMDRVEVERLINRGAVPAIQERRTPSPEPRVALPAALARKFAAVGDASADAVRRSGARVFGDIRSLGGGDAAAELEPPSRAPRDLVDAFARGLASTTGRRRGFDRAATIVGSDGGADDLSWPTAVDALAAMVAEAREALGEAR